MFKNFANKASQATAGSPSARWTLMEELAALNMLEEGHSVKDVSEILGRSENSIKYKIVEPPAHHGGADKPLTCRSTRKYFYKNPSKPAEGFFEGTDEEIMDHFLTGLFASYKVKYEGGQAGHDQVNALLDQFADSKTAQSTEAV